MSDISRVSFGDHDAQVTRVGLGGEGILRTFGEDAGAELVISAAMAQGIGYFDTAPAYSGSEGYLGAYWRAHPGARETIFHTSKSAERTAAGAEADLEHTLEALGCDYLDLWQIHDVRTEDDFAAIAAPGGALEAFAAARETGTVRHIGVTGHHDPTILTRCVREWPLDSVLLPVNPVEGALGGFLTDTLPAAQAKGLAIIGMKVLGGRSRDFSGNYVSPEGGVTPELLLRYALSQPVTCLIVGCATPEHVRTLADAVRGFSPFSSTELAEIETAFQPVARRLAFYRGVI